MFSKQKNSICVMLALALTAGMMAVPIAASAAGKTVEVSDESTLRTAMANASGTDRLTIKLTDDITSSATFTAALYANITLDLNGHNITVTGANAITANSRTNGAGTVKYTFIVAGDGTVTSATGAAIYTKQMQANIEIQGGEFIGATYGLHYDASNSSGSVTITGGKFRGAAEGNYYDVKIGIAPSQITDADITSLYNSSVLKAGGQYRISGLKKWYGGVNLNAKDEDISISFDNASLLYGTIYAGNYSGTVSSQSSRTLRGGIYSTELKESMTSIGLKPYSSNSDVYNWKDNGDGTWTITNAVEQYKISAVSADTAQGTLSNPTMYIYNGNYVSSPPTVNEGTEVRISTTATPAKGYDFKGWYYNAEGTGEPISVDPQLNQAFKVTGDTVIYAVFEENELIVKSREWLGDYSSTSAYTISSIGELEYFGYCVNWLKKNFSGKTVTLLNDLDMSGAGTHESIGYSTLFAGTFDGGGHVIKNISCIAGYKAEGGSYSYSGLFGKTARSAMIKNLTVTDSIFGGASMVGAIVGDALGRLENVKVSNVTISGQYVGGIVGHSYGLTIDGAEASNITSEGGESGAVIGYSEGLTLKNVTVSDITPGAVYCDLVAQANTATVIQNVNCNTPGVPLIGGDRGSTKTITISGDNNVTASCVIWSQGATTLTINSGTYIVDNVVLSQGSSAKLIAKEGVRFSIDADKYAEDGCGVYHTSDDLYIVAKKIAATVDAIIAEQAPGEVGATGFVTTVTSPGEISIAGIKWTVTSTQFNELVKAFSPDMPTLTLAAGSAVRVALIIDEYYDTDILDASAEVE